MVKDERVCYLCGKTVVNWDIITEGYICYECQQNEED